MASSSSEPSSWILLPLQVTEDCSNLQELLSACLDEQERSNNNSSSSNDWQLSSYECQDDLARLADQRSACVVALLNGNNSNIDNNGIDNNALQEYAASLAVCQAKGFPCWTDAAGAGGVFTWSSAQQDSSTETHSSLAWERANIVYNLATLKVQQAIEPAGTSGAAGASAPPPSLDTRKAWLDMSKTLQEAATLVHYLSETALLPEQTATDGNASSFATLQLQPAFLHIWQDLLLAMAQRATYQAAASATRPKNFMLAKLAAAATPLLEQAAMQCQELLLHEQQQQQQQQQSGNSSSTAVTRLLESWCDTARAWELCFSALAEYHQSVVHGERQEGGLEVARLQVATKFAIMTLDLTASADTAELRQLDTTVRTVLQKMEARLEQVDQENSVSPQDVPDATSLPEIQPQLAVYANQSLETLLPPLATPIFATGLDPVAKRFVKDFLADTDQFLFQTTVQAQEKTESGRKALALVNLPHALTAYRQELAGGGIPDELWARIVTVQQGDHIARLQQELWQLQNTAQGAREVYKKVYDNLQEDEQMDELFREQHATFEGHNVPEVQKTYRQSLQNCNRLLVAAQEGDAVLLQRLAVLDSDPKYRLLVFKKSQLDRLLPGLGSRAEIDVSTLSRHLVDLSALFSDRERAVQALQQEVKSFHIGPRLAEVNVSDPEAAESEYRRIVDAAQESLRQGARKIQANVESQAVLLRTILDENQVFMRARDASNANSPSDSCIGMIEDAIEEIQQLSTHLQEGSDFYKVIVPKLEGLRQQVDDVSRRLTIERFEFEDKTRTSRQRQLNEDARMAASFGNTANTNSVVAPPPQSQSSMGATAVRPEPPPQRPPPPQPYEGGGRPMPGVEAVAHDKPVVRVDDEKVANLVAMDFDPIKVVAALKKYDNHVEQAVDELLANGGIME